MGRNVTRDDGDQKRTEVVIGEAQSSRDELLTAIAKLEQYANDLRRVAEQKRGIANRKEDHDDR